MTCAETGFFDDISAQVILHVLKRAVLKWGRPAVRRLRAGTSTIGANTTAALALI